MKTDQIGENVDEEDLGPARRALRRGAGEVGGEGVESAGRGRDGGENDMGFRNMRFRL